LPRYFFHVQDGQEIPDPTGTVLPDLDAAREQAVRFSGELLRDNAKSFWTGEEWFMEVHDDSALLFTLTFSARHRSSPDEVARLPLPTSLDTV
jgi:hypothetical protein